MDISVSDEAIKATTKCRKFFSCLKEKDRNFCAVANCINEEILFMKTLKNACCPYQQAFGNEFLCDCPVRKEIFVKYKI